MKALLIGGAALVLAVPAFAQVASAPVPAPRVAKVHTRAEVQARVAQHFAQIDTNRDGSVTKAEADAARTQFREKAGERMKQRVERRGEQAFERLDANNDGQISRQEFDAGRQLRTQRLAHRGDRAHRGGRMMGMRMGALHGRMFETADANRDGRVTLAEAQTAALQHFDMVDVNRDGQITPDERVQMRQRVRAQRNRG